MGDSQHKYRLITRSDFDGLACAVLLKAHSLIEEIKFVHPKDMQDGLISVTSNDITTNLPYVDGVHLAFDHHYSEMVRVGPRDNHVIDPDAPSAARVVYEHYGGAEAFPMIPEDFITAVDKGDSAQFTIEEVLHPERWNLLNFIMDARTGLGRFKEFRISNYQLMMDLIDYCASHSIDEILEVKDVQERSALYREHESLFKDQIRSVSRLEDNVLVVDLRAEDVIYAGNRFVKYALYPDTNVSIQVMWGFKKQNTVIAVGKSIFNATSLVNIGDIMLAYGGGGHTAAGTCQVPNEAADSIVAEIVQKVKN